MWLAGEEFGDVHDTDYVDVNAKQQDPVQWNRAAFRGKRSSEGERCEADPIANVASRSAAQ